MKFSPNRIVCFVTLLLLLAVPFRRSRAQQEELTSQVTQIAGATIYLSSGSDDSIVQGDTLYIYRDNAFQGALVVQGVASKSLSAEFANAPFALTRGQTVVIRFNKPSPQEVARQQPEAATPSRPSILGTAPSAPEQAPVRGPRVSGHLSFSGYAMGSRTRWSDVQRISTNRWFATPSTNLSAQVTNLPGGLSLDANMAYSYRYAGTTAISPAGWPRFYRLNLEKSFQTLPVTVTAGRFYNRYEIFSGFWDGAMIRAGSRTNGVGAMAGYEPVRGDEGFRTDLPKYSAYTYQEFNLGTFRSSTELDVTMIRPRINLNDHLYAGAYQQFLFNRHRLSFRLQADRNLQTGRWKLSQMMVRGMLAVSDFLELHGAYNRLQPYYLYALENPFGGMRTEVTGGAGFRFNGGSAGLDLTRLSSEYSPSATAVSAYAQAYRTPWWNLGFSINGQLWHTNNYNTVRLAPAVNRDFNNLNLGLGYEFYFTDFVTRRYITHTADLSAMLSLGTRWYLQADLRTGYGIQFINSSLQFSLWRSF